MLVLRVVRNRDRLFLMRLSDWVMATMLVCMGFLLLSDPDLFSRSAVFSGISRLLDEQTSAVACALVGGCRMIALIAFATLLSWSHRAAAIRAVLALLSGAVWMQLALGFWAAGGQGNAGLGRIVYPGLVAFEIINMLVASIDAANERG